MADKANGHTGTVGNPKGNAASMTKQEALRRALSDLGKDALPMQLQAHIKDKFGIAMTTSHISASKTDIVRKMIGGTKPIPANSAAKTTAPKPAATVNAATKPTIKKPTSTKPATIQSQAKPAAAASSNRKASGTLALIDVQTVKTLVGRVGATDLKTLIDLLAK